MRTTDASPSPGPPDTAGMSAEAEALFRTHQQQIYRDTDRLFARLMMLQWAAGVAFALVISPRAWAGTTSQTHVHVWAAVVLGGAISVFPAVLAWVRPGQPATRYTIAVAQMLMSALLIHLTGGRIETHFHVFGSLAFLAFYRDWRVLIPATIVVAVDHALRGIFWPQSVFGTFVPSEWRWLEHAAWVVFEDIVLMMSCVRGTRELRQIAERTAALQDTQKAQARHALDLAELVARLRVSQDEAQQATRAKSEFIANMSHELRTPLNAITLYSELLQENAEADGRETDVADHAKILTASKHLLGLINGLLDLSKVEAGRMELDLEHFEIRPAVEDLISTMDALVRKNGNTLRVTFGPDIGTMYGDATKVRQILFNLLSNAGKFTTNGRITLHVARRAGSGADCIELVVSDTGIGLTEQQRSRLFQPFVQADASIARKYGGTGLGLAIVARFCQLMGGTVTAADGPEGGTRFTVSLPVEVTPAAPVAQSPAA